MKESRVKRIIRCFQIGSFIAVMMIYSCTSDNSLETRIESRSASTNASQAISQESSLDSVSIDEIVLLLNEVYSPYHDFLRWPDVIEPFVIVDTVATDFMSGEQAFALLTDRHDQFIEHFSTVSSNTSLLYANSKVLPNSLGFALSTSFYYVTGEIAEQANPTINCSGSFEDSDCWLSSLLGIGSDLILDVGDCDGNNLDNSAQTMVQSAINQEVPRHVPGNKYEPGGAIIYEDVTCIEFLQGEQSLEIFGEEILAAWDCCLDFPFYESGGPLHGGQMNCYQSFIRDAIVNQLPEGYSLVSVDIGADLRLNVPGDQLFWYINQYCFGIPTTVSIAGEPTPAPPLDFGDLMGG